MRAALFPRRLKRLKERVADVEQREVNAALQRERLQEEIAGLNTDVDAIRQALGGHFGITLERPPKTTQQQLRELHERRQTEART